MVDIKKTPEEITLSKENCTLEKISSRNLTTKLKSTYIPVIIYHVTYHIFIGLCICLILNYIHTIWCFLSWKMGGGGGYTFFLHVIFQRKPFSHLHCMGWCFMDVAQYEKINVFYVTYPLPQRQNNLKRYIHSLLGRKNSLQFSLTEEPPTILYEKKTTCGFLLGSKQDGNLTAILHITWET